MKLPFKSNEAFFEYCNGQFSPKPRVNEGRPAIVPGRGYLQIENHVSELPDGRYRVSLLVCGAPQGFFLVSETPKTGGAEIRHGDLLIWKAAKSPPLIGKGLLGQMTGDKRSSWIGFIVAKIAPEIDTQTGKFTVLSRY